MINNLNLYPLYLSIYLSITTTMLLIITGIPISWYLSKTKKLKLKIIINTLISLPLVIPPTILGFYLLILFSPNSPIGKIWEQITGSTLAFSFSGLIIGSYIYSLPFVIQPILISFEKIRDIQIDQAIMLGASKVYIFKKIIIPLSKNGIITAAALSFAHTLGEFGIILMIGGNIPEKTQVISIAIYELVEQLDYTSAHKLSIITLLLSFIILTITFYINTKNANNKDTI